MNLKWLKIFCFVQIVIILSGCATTCYYVDDNGKQYSAEEVKRLSCTTCPANKQDKKRTQSPIIGGDSGGHRAPILGGDSGGNAEPIVSGDVSSTKQPNIGGDIADDDIQKRGFTKVCK
ncbi:MAG: hypothetical protein ABW124_20390 [Candidatus Thiodiazotropha sp. 6PLUC9]